MDMLIALLLFMPFVEARSINALTESLSVASGAQPITVAAVFVSTEALETSGHSTSFTYQGQVWTYLRSKLRSFESLDAVCGLKQCKFLLPTLTRFSKDGCMHCWCIRSICLRNEE